MDYCYEDNWYQVSPSPTYIPLGVFSLNSVEPSQLESSTEALPAGTLAMPGRYRFCVENVGYVSSPCLRTGAFMTCSSEKGSSFGKQTARGGAAPGPLTMKWLRCPLRKVAAF